MSLTAIAELCGVSRACVGRWVNRYGLRDLAQPYRNRDWLKKRYTKGLPIEEIAKQANCGCSTITKWVRIHGLRRRRGDLLLCESYFSVVDTPEKSYWLGFLAADGSVSDSPGKRLLSVGLARKDAVHLERLKTVLNSDKRLYFSEKDVRLQVCSKRLVVDLIKHGVVPRKSLILRPPPINIEFISHWIRGYFDGDGSVYVDKLGNLRGDVVGTNSVVRFIKTHCDVFTGPTKKGNCWEIRFSGNKKANKLATYLYNSATIYLARKRNIFDATGRE